MQGIETSDDEGTRLMRGSQSGRVLLIGIGITLFFLTAVIATAAFLV